MEGTFSGAPGALPGDREGVHDGLARASALAGQGRHREAQELLLGLLPLAASVAADRAAVLCALGETLEALGDRPEAERCLRSALEAVPGHPRALRGLGNMAAQQGQRAEAERHFKVLLALHRNTLPPDDLYEVLMTIARLRAAEGDREGLKAAIETALRHRPSSREARDLLIAWHRQAGNFDKVAEHLRRLLDFTTDAGERLAILLELGDLLGERLGNVDEADRTYQEAAELLPDDTTALERRVALHRKAGRVREELRGLAALAAPSASADRSHRARYYYQMGALYRDHLEDATTALACFNQALDLDPDLLDAFEEGAALLRKAEDWTGLEAHFRLMLGRLATIAERPTGGRGRAPGSDGDGEGEREGKGEGGETARGMSRLGIRGTLWRNLGEVYRLHLEDPASAAVAYEVASHLRPDDLEVRCLLADLWDRDPTIPPARRVKLHRDILSRSPERIESLRGLRAAYLAEGRLDAAWCVGARTAACEGIDPELAESLTGPRRALPLPYRLPLDAEAFDRHVRHPAEEPEVSQLLEALGALVGDALARDLREHGVGRRDRLDPTSPLLVVRLLGPLAGLLGFPAPPEVYRTDEPTGDVRVTATREPALVVGPDVLGTGSAATLAFRLGRALAYLRPACRLARILPPPELAALLRSAGVPVVLVGEAEGGAGEPPSRFGGLIESALARPEGARAAALVRGVAEGRPGAPVDLGRWLTGLALTADRVGLLACEDPAAARDVVGNRWDELAAYAISEEYFAARHEIGLALSPEAGGGDGSPEGET